MEQAPPSGSRSGHIPVHAWTGFRCPQNLVGCSGRGNTAHEGCEVERRRLQRIIQKSRIREDDLKDKVKRMKTTVANMEKSTPTPPPKAASPAPPPTTTTTTTTSHADKRASYSAPRPPPMPPPPPVCIPSASPVIPVAGAVRTLSEELQHAFATPAPSPAQVLQQHLEQINLTRPIQCTVHNCSRMFPTEYAMSLHVSNVHLKKERNKQ
jgi:hypothetical protein